MPYKNPEDQKACWKRWHQRNLKKYKKIQKIHALAKTSNPKRDVCSIKGCKEIGERHHPDYSKPKEIIWLCTKHHKQVHLEGKKYCSVENCQNIHRAKGFCAKHYMQWKRNTLSDNLPKLLRRKR